MTIAVIGQGFVGGSLTTVMSENGETVYVFDKVGKVAPGGLPLTFDNRPVKSVPEFVQECENDVAFSGVYFVCLPTPMFEDGSADLSIVEQVLSEIANTHHIGDIPRIAVVKSTVPPGTTLMWNKRFNNDDLHIVFCPEFLTEANALNDMRNQTRIVLGGPRPYINVVKNIFSRTFPKVPLIKTSSTTAEMVKYVTNCFLATKVSFANEMAQICEKLDRRGLDIDYDKVIEYSKFDERLGNSHWTVPGPDGSRGWGGHCIVAGTDVMLSDFKEVKIEDMTQDDILLSTDNLLNEIETKAIKSLHKRHYTGNVIKICTTVNDRKYSITCTPEHLLPVERNGYILLLEAKYILDTDNIFLIQ